MPGNHPRRQVGTIVLRSPIYNFGELDMDRGLTIVILYQLAHHYMEWVIPPNQYDCVYIVPNIQEYWQIKHYHDLADLEGSLQAQYIDPGAPFGYDNVTALDYHDNSEDHVTNNWDSREMELVDLFYLGVHYNGHTVHYTFIHRGKYMQC